MKSFISSFLFSIILGFGTIASAAVVVEEYGAPITVERDSYTVSEPSYYYYSGHRCYVKERCDLGVNFLGLHAGVGGGKQIYCYPYQ